MADVIDSSELIGIYKDTFNFKVYAGPGAGKTYFLIQNIKEIVEKSNKLKNEKNRKILCITYTNVAVDEIKKRLGQHCDYVVVKTIHSFLYDYVIKPYQQQLKLIINQTFNINISKTTILKPRLEGFGLLTKLKQSDFVGLLIEKYNLHIASELSKRKINDCVLDISAINKYPFNEKNIPNIKIITNINTDDLLKIKTALWEEEGVLDFDEILYFSYILLKKFNFITYDIQFRFPYILMDEYQDTNPIQNKILNILCNEKVTVGVVGDIAQSIYGFINSTYREFEEFHPNVKEFKTFVIDGNRRSNKNIVHFLNYVRQNDLTLNTQQCILNNSSSKVKFVLCDKENVDILKMLRVPNIRVLCRRWTDAFEYITNIEEEQRYYLKQVHDFYRYVIDRDLTKDFDNSNINWINNIKIIISTYKAIKLGNFAGILKELEKIFIIDILKIDKKTKGGELKEILRFIEMFKTFNESDSYSDIVEKINNFIETTTLKHLDKLENIGEDDERFEEDFHPYLHKLNIKTMQVMFEEVFSEDSKYVTVHKTKGKEYDSVLVNLVPIKEERKLKNILNVLENPNIFDKENDSAAEFVRIAYVAFSRAKNNLYIHLKNNIIEIQTLLKNLDRYCINNGIYEPFYEVIDLNT